MDTVAGGTGAATAESLAAAAEGMSDAPVVVDGVGSVLVGIMTSAAHLPSLWIAASVSYMIISTT